MTRERCLKKSFKDSLEDIKERMKERRNKKWAQLGKTKQVLSVSSKIASKYFLILYFIQVFPEIEILGIISIFSQTTHLHC